MMTQQNFKELNQQLDNLKLQYETSKTSKTRSFRSKMFQKNTVKLIPKVNDKQIQLHNPRYPKYLQRDIKIKKDIEIPQIWGCLMPQLPKNQSPKKKNFQKRKIDTSANLFRNYLDRKNRLIFEIPTMRKFHSQQKSSKLEYRNPEQQIEKQFSKFFTEIKPIKQRQKHNLTVDENTTRYSDQKHQEFRFSKLLPTTKPTSSSCNSRFSQLLCKDQGNFTCRQGHRIDNKSIYNMSIDQLRQSINWKRKLLKQLNQTVAKTKNEK